MPGRPYVGIEVPNPAKTLVSLRSILESKEFAKVGSPLAVALGRDVSGDPVVADLTRMPHLLIAGATGSGKSVCINAHHLQPADEQRPGDRALPDGGPEDGGAARLQRHPPPARPGHHRSEPGDRRAGLAACCRWTTATGLCRHAACATSSSTTARSAASRTSSRCPTSCW